MKIESTGNSAHHPQGRTAMQKFTLTTTDRQAEFLENFLDEVTDRNNCIPEAAVQIRASFGKQTRPMPTGKKITVYVTHFPELCQLNGLSCPVYDAGYMNLAVPNFLAERLGLEPLGHELGLEVFGQGLHHTAIPLVESGWVTCSTRANCQPSKWSDDKKHLLLDHYSASAIRLEQKQFGDCTAYPTSHVARSEERMLLLYAKQGTEVELFNPRRIMGM